MNTKARKVIKWVLIGLLTLQFLAAGLSKLTGGWEEPFASWGYSASFAIVIGIVEVMFVVGLYFKPTRKWSILLLCLVMFGAMYTHLMAEEYMRILHNAILVLFGLGVFLLDR